MYVPICTLCMYVIRSVVRFQATIRKRGKNTESSVIFEYVPERFSYFEQIYVVLNL